LKFAYNVAWWRGEYTHNQKGPRHVATGTDPLQGLIERWTHNGSNPLQPNQPAPTLLPTVASPLVVDNVVLGVMAARGTTPTFAGQAYELEPSDDYDGSGKSDNGPPDYSVGAPYDRLAGFQVPGSYVSGLAYGELNDQGFLFVGGQAGTDGGAWVLAAPNP